MRRRSNITNASNDDFNCEYHQVSQVELDEKVPPRSQNPGPESQDKIETQGKAEVQKVQGKVEVQGKTEVQKDQSKSLVNDPFNETHHFVRVAKRKHFYSLLEEYLKNYQKNFYYANSERFLLPIEQKINHLLKGMVENSFPFKIPEYQQLQEYTFLAQQEVRIQKVIADAKSQKNVEEKSPLIQKKGTIQVKNSCINARCITSISFEGDNIVIDLTNNRQITLSNKSFSQEGFKLYYEYLVAHWQYCLDD